MINEKVFWLAHSRAKKMPSGTKSLILSILFLKMLKKNPKKVPMIVPIEIPIRPAFGLFPMAFSLALVRPVRRTTSPSWKGVSFSLFLEM